MLMAEHPDSSLALLEAVNPSELRSESSRALYGLLLTQAQFKNYAPPQDDSLITSVADYYEGTGRDDSRHRMLANYYYGRARLNEKDYAKSLFAFFNAYELATAEADPFWAAMSAERISEIYFDTYNYKEMLKFAEIEYDKFNEFGNPLYIHDGLLDLAIAYHCNGSYDSAITLCKQLVDTAKLYDDDPLMENSIRQIAISYFGKAQYDSSIIYYQRLCDSPYGIASDSAYLGLLFHRNGEDVKARSVLQGVDLSGDMSLNLKYEVCKILGEDNTIFDITSAIMREMNDILNGTVNQNLSGTIFEYYQYRLKSEIERKHLANIVAWLIGCGAFILILGVCYFAYRYIVKQRQIVNRNVEIAENLKEILVDKEKETDKIILSMLGERFDVLDNLCKLMYETPNKTQAKRKISQEVELMIKQCSQDQKRIKELEQYADTHYGNIVSDFRRDLPTLIPNDYLLFMYSLYGFSSSAIALFLELDNVSGVYDRRKRLKNKIKTIGGKNKDRYLAVLA